MTKPESRDGDRAANARSEEPTPAPAGERARSLAIWSAGGVALCGCLLIVWFFAWAARHDAGDGVAAPYPLELTHGVLGGLVGVLLLAAVALRRPGAFRPLHLLPLALALGYAGTVLSFVARAWW